MMFAGVEKAIKGSRLRPEEHIVQLGIGPIDHSKVRFRHGDIQSQVTTKPTLYRAWLSPFVATMRGMALDERALFTAKPETRPGRYQCPRCRRTGEYSIRWVRHSKKDRLPPGADEGDRAKFAKVRDYLLRVDDEVTCKTCGKKFEIPSQQSLLFVDQLTGLPNDEDLEREIEI